MYLYCTVLSGRTVLYRLSRNSSSGHIFEEHVFAFPKKRELRTLFFFVPDTFSAATDLNVHSSGNVFCVLPDTLFIRLTHPSVFVKYRVIGPNPNLKALSYFVKNTADYKTKTSSTVVCMYAPNTEQMPKSGIIKKYSK